MSWALMNDCFSPKYIELPRGTSQGREGSPVAEGKLFVKKDPSPESVKALLHGRLALRGKRVLQPSQSTDPQVEKLITDIIDESPSKNSSLDQSLSEETPVVIACTPLRTSRPKQALLLDTPLKVEAVIKGSEVVGVKSDATTGAASADKAFLSSRSVNVLGQAIPTVPGGLGNVSPIATGFTTPVRRPPAGGGWSSVLQEHTNSPDLFATSPCSGPGCLYNTPTTCTDGPTPSSTPFASDCHWSSPQLAPFRREFPVSMETDSHMAFLMSTPPKSGNALPTSFLGIFPKAE